ncbi:MAG: UDP-N-acetylmuramoyl-L-alanine--D-glutamate ligase [Bacteriovoracaceae bacterium]|nr:UDP-N-acetylmuramoyl-L-alanine--D-glutamate ligase [Bacteriovoracaceae bacterium]
MFNLKNKRIAIYGMGVSGISALRLANSLEAQCIAINGGDVSNWAKSPGVLDHIGIDQCYNETDPSLPQILSQIELVILSPGIAREHPLLLPLLDKNIPIIGEIELAYRYLEAKNLLSPIVGITGTNGKTTSTTFLGEMIKNDHKSVFVGGNIGIPFCDYAYDIFNNKLPSDIILLELSSFQLESIERFHVDVAIILNLFQNHGERYNSIEDYGRSKFHITNRFTNNDTLIYPEDFKIIASWASKEPGQKRIINTQNPSIKYSTKNFKLPGHHNLVNLAFIIEAAECLKLSTSAINQTIESFSGVHHRIEFVDSPMGLTHFKVFNDAKSTNWDATLTAVAAMNDFKLPIHLIIGGKKRGHGDSILPSLEFLKKHVFKFYLIGEMADEIESEIKSNVLYEKTKTLEETIRSVRRQFGLEAGILLFSPGFPSFDQFQNYAHRGEHFIGLVTSNATT